MSLKIELFSDVICPWCYVGKRRLEAALRELGSEFAVEVTWLPFELNPAMPADGISRREYRAAKFGSWEESQARDAQLAQLGREEGLVFAFDRMERTPNTRQAHRLIWLAQREGAGEAVVEGLFRAYFTEGRDIGAAQELAAIAGDAGLDAARVGAFLAGKEGAAEVEAEEERGRQLGIDGVPMFVVNGRYGISGAQPAARLAAALRQIAAEG